MALAALCRLTGWPSPAAAPAPRRPALALGMRRVMTDLGGPTTSASGFRRCLADYDLMAGAYEILAADYDWMFDDDELANGRAINHPSAARLLQRISRTSAVLDAACGTGVDAAVLARRGFTVWAADGSEAMVEGAAARFRRERVGVPPLACAVAGLSPATGRRVCVLL